MSQPTRTTKLAKGVYLPDKWMHYPFDYYLVYSCLFQWV